ncbi:MAG: hypothetical protein JXJ22_04400 [Bacteroidales bacterium]|nr:hypothetical protein [Bacteroidales bacterium]
MSAEYLIAHEKSISKKEYVEIRYSDFYKLMHYIWKAPVNSKQYRETFLTGLKYAEDHPVDYFMSDIRKQKIVSPNDRRWFEDVAMPMAVERGLKKACAIFDGNIFKEYYLNNILLKTRKFQLPFRFFKNEADALNWLTSADN